MFETKSAGECFCDDYDTIIKICEGDFGAFTFEYVQRSPCDTEIGPDDP